MKVTVKFGRTAVVVPCKDGWLVRDLMDQATQRYRKLLEQDGEFVVRTHHVEYADGGILDPDDMLTDLLEDKDKLIAVFEETELQRRGAVSPGESEASGYSSPYASEPELGVLRPAMGTEIEVTSSALKSNTPLMVRSSSELVLPRSPDFFTREVPNSKPATGVRGGAMDPPRTDVPTARGGPISSSLTRTVDIFGDMGPLGIKVVAYCSSLSGRPLGLNVKSIEENSRTKKEGLLREDESIVQINDVTLMDKSFAESQEVFRQAMSSPLVRLEVLPTSHKLQYEKSLIGQIFSGTDAHGVPKTKSPFLLRKMDGKPPDPAYSQTPPPREQPPARPSPVQVERRRETPSPSFRTSSSPRSRSESPALTALANAANKKGGKKKITLTKGPDGLGFTVVTRDSSVHGPGPILVKSILSRGAAIRDGRLQSGDRILEVNGTDITGFRQEDLVSMLRGTKQGETVSLVVSRAEDVFLPRELKADPSGPPRSQDGVEQLLLDVPVSDSGSAGLGVSLKGNKSRETGEDLGIFIKSIIHGGAAFKDGRLRVNDQLVAVNGESLLGRSNHEAMETLRRSMSVDGNLRDIIQLLIFRPLNRSPAQDVQVREPSPSNYSQSNGGSQPPMVINSIYGSAPGHDLRSRVYEEEEDYSDEDLHTPPSDLDPMESDANQNQRYQQPRYPVLALGHPATNQNILRPAERGPSKSMDLVPNEGNIGAMQTHRPAPSFSLGPTLGLRKSSSLESLQSAMEEVSKNQLPFHRPAGPMVRGRGCNMSFRQAIDKSYEGPSEPEEDDSEDSGRETPASSSSRQELDDLPKDKKKKTKKKKEKKSKSKKKDDPEEAEKKPKKKGFGLLRFGKKNKDGKSKVKMGSLSEEELDKSEAEIGSHGTLQRPVPNQPQVLDVEDDDYDPNYARINHFRDPPSSAHPANVPPPLYVPPPGPAYNDPPPHEDPLEGLYAKVNKMKPAAQQPSSSNEARLQQIRSQLQHLKPLPSYGETGAAVRTQEYNPTRIRGPDPRMAPKYEDADRQFATVPRRMEDQKDASRPSNPYQSQTGPFRYDVPPSLGPRAAPSYESAMRSRTPDPEQYGAYGEGQYPNHGHKNPAIGAV